MTHAMADTDADLAAELAADEAAYERELAVYGAIDQLLTRLDAHINEDVLLAGMSLAAADDLLADCLQAVDITFVEREDQAVESDGYELWRAEPEPPRVEIDTWARGALPVRVRPRSTSGTEGTRRGAASPSLDARSPRSPNSKPNSKASARTEAEPQPSAAMLADVATLTKPGSAGSGAGRPPKVAPSFVSTPAASNLSPEEAEMESRLREEIQNRQAAQQYRRQQARARAAACAAATEVTFRTGNF